MRCAKAASPVFALDQAGYFTRHGKRVIPVGANYWPGSCGAEMWQAWPEKEIQADLDLVVKLGLNCVRFFLRWQDFEPAPGRYDRRMFARLQQMLLWHEERQLLAHPSLFVGWMSGGIFWPVWHRGRNVYADLELRRRAFAFAHKSAAICAGFPETALAVDHGNELCCLPECLTATPADVASWCAGVSGAIRRGFPGALIVSGNEQNQVNADTGWRLGAQAGCDFYSMHAYPFPGWHTLPFDGMTDPLAQSLLPFYVKCARAFGPVMVQEFGTLLTGGEKQCDGYLRTVLPACREAGANGYLWWCLRDITARTHPYNKNAFEASLGLVDAKGRVKPALRYFLEFARSLAGNSLPSASAPPIGLLWPEEYYPRDNPANPGNLPSELSRQMALAHFTLGTLGSGPKIVRGRDLRPGLVPARVLIAGAKITAAEVLALTPWVEAGGQLIWHGVDALTWGPETTRLVGAMPVDFCAPTALGVRAFGRIWDLHEFPRGIFLETLPREATVVARDDRKRPLILVHHIGRGCVVTCLASPEVGFAKQSDSAATRAQWKQWYRGMLNLLPAQAGRTQSAPRQHGQAARRS